MKKMKKFEDYNDATMADRTANRPIPMPSRDVSDPSNSRRIPQIPTSISFGGTKKEYIKALEAMIDSDASLEVITMILRFLSRDENSPFKDMRTSPEYQQLIRKFGDKMKNTGFGE